MEDRYRFFFPVQVRYIETDMQGHVFFGHYFTYFDAALIDYLKAVGYTYNDFLRDGVDFYYIHADCQYKGRAFFDEVLHVHARIGNIGNTSFTFEFSIYEENEDRHIATGRIIAVAIDKQTLKPVRVPDALREGVLKFEGGNQV